jgi:hypothetical protein
MRRSKLLFYVSVALSTALLMDACQSRSRSEVDKIIADSETLSTIDRLCQSLARPADFVELEKGFGGNSAHSSIEYQYKTSKSFDSVVDHFKTECRNLTGCAVISEYNNKENTLFRNLKLRLDRVNIGIEYRPSFASLINLGCSN